jgi:MFS family permease
MRVIPADRPDSDKLALLKQRNVVLFLIARLFANIGAQMQTVAVGWQVYEKTGSALDLGWIGLSQFAPFVLLILPAGHFADHHDRRRILTACYSLQAFCALAFGFYTWSGSQQVWPIFVVMVLLGIARAFSMPAGQSLLPNLVSKEQFSRAVAMNATMFQGSTIVGPTLGGLLLLLGVQTVYVAVLICGVLCITAITNIEVPPRVTSVDTPAARTKLDITSLLSGLNFVRSQPLVLGAISLDLFAVLFGGATALLPIYARDILHVGPTGLGMLRSAVGLGALVSAL